MKHLKVKKWMANLGILFLLTLSICLVSCLNWIMEKPSFVLREIILSPSSLTEAKLLIGLDVQNPNRFDLTLKSFEYVLFLDDEGNRNRPPGKGDSRPFIINNAGAGICSCKV